MPPPLYPPTAANITTEEEYELGEDGNLLGTPEKQAFTPKYKEGSSIDWLREESSERERIQAQRSLHGVRGLLSLWGDSFFMWIIVVATGIGIGVAGAWLDVLVKWCVSHWETSIYS
jgi:chloride channel 3/4/5